MSKESDLEKARFRVQIFEQCELTAKQLSIIQKKYARGSEEAEALKKAKNALLFILTRRLDEFIEFSAEMNAGFTSQQELRLRDLGISTEESDDTI